MGEDEVVRRGEIGGRNWAELRGHSALGVLHRYLEVIVPARLQSPLEYDIRLAHRIVLGAG